ncbi:MAG: hypothetical protein AAFN78_19840 [Pseudomonadota bacterium]
MESGLTLIVGKLLLTFGVLIGLPLLDLWLMHREERSRDENEP